MEGVIDRAQQEADEKGVRGKDITPFCWPRSRN
jgi:pseudouridine-5'-phosphate glycosidase